MGRRWCRIALLAAGRVRSLHPLDEFGLAVGTVRTFDIARLIRQQPSAVSAYRRGRVNARGYRIVERRIAGTPVLDADWLTDERIETMGAKRRFGEGHADTEREVAIDLQRGAEDRGLQFGDDGVMSPAELAAELGCCPHCGVEPDERHMPSCPTRRR